MALVDCWLNVKSQIIIKRSIRYLDIPDRKMHSGGEGARLIGSTKGLTSNKARTWAIVVHTRASAKCRPGQILNHSHCVFERIANHVKTRLLPNPNARLLGSSSRFGFSLSYFSAFSSLMPLPIYRSGEKTSGLGNISPSFIICLESMR